MDEPKESTDLFQKLGYLIYIFIAALGFIFYGIAKIVELYSKPNVMAVLLDVSAGFFLTAFIFFFLERFGFNRDERRHSKLKQATTNLNEATLRLDKAVGNINRLEILEESDLIRYCDQIIKIGIDEWYERLAKSTGQISLMAPSLITWFKNLTKMRDTLVQKACEGIEIRFIIMGAENDVAERIAQRPNPGANVGFYERGVLEKNQNDMANLLRDVNKRIKEKSNQTPPNYVRLRKITRSPMFIKAEFFGDILH